MTAPRRLLTLHGPMKATVASELLTAIEEALGRLGAARVWIDPDSHPDMAIMVEMPATVRDANPTG
ncbi:hypothetical protein ACT8ZV_00755 [Nocardioides sp. MAHUQ-72]|uniref:hypothetical protein n=1 Tax=unclassified Nocardioides TaxID=2615069 RepID=UPI00361A7518